MKSIYSFLSILMPIFAGVSPVFGNNYYFSTNNGDDSRSAVQAQSSSTPWRSLVKLNQVFSQLQPGDSVLFNRGEVYYGAIVAGASGSAARPIVIAAYGQGYDPVISGFSRLTGWKAGAANGVWQAPCDACGMRVNMVTVKNEVQPMGRYPNSGWLTVQSHSGNTSITDNSLPGGTDWTGAEVVIRKNRFTIDRCSILSQQGGALTYKGGAYYPPTDGFGYFIQNDIRTLDEPGEWYYDPKAHVMNVFYGTAPDVLVSTVETLVTVQGKQNLVFTGLCFSGSNGNAITLADAVNVTVSWCQIHFASLDGVNAIRSNNLQLMHITVDQSGDDGIDLVGQNNMVSDCVVRRTGTVPGMGNATNSYIGIDIDGQNNTVQYNRVDTTGYVGIFFLKGPNLIKNNTVDFFCYLKDDGGGIYTWSGDIDSATQRNTGIVTGNIVLNGVAAVDGADPKVAGIAMGIYLDENTGMVEVSGNTVAHCTTGIFLQDAHEVVVRGNTLYDNGVQLSVRHALMKGTLRNNEITGNTAVSVKKDETVLVMSSAVSGDVGSFTSLHDNHYSQPGGGSFYKTVVRQNNQNVQDRGALGDWQSKYGKDANSVQATPVAGIRFEYNASKNVKTVSLDGTYKDSGGKTYQGQLKLGPYTSDILMRQ